MKLAEFLAEHVREERCVQGPNFCLDAGLIQAGIEAFAKAEHISIDVWHWATDDEDMPKIIDREMYE